MMKRFLLLPILLSVINILPISAQVMEGAETKGLVYLPEEQSRLRQENQVDGHSFSRPRKADETTPVRFAIKAGVAGLCKDYDGNLMTMPAAMDSVRFEIIDDTAKTVMIGTETKVAETERYGWSFRRAIYNQNYTGAIDIPSQVKYNNQWYKVVRISSHSFDMRRTDMPSSYPHTTRYNTNSLTSTIKIHVKNLEEIGEYAFRVFSYTDSYYSVVIKTDKYLTIGKSAFATDYFFPAGMTAEDMTTQDMLDNPDRRDLETVKIVADGMKIQDGAFVRPGLRTLDITSTGGLITIGVSAFDSGTMYYHVNNRVTPNDTLTHRPLNSNWERRNNKTDYIRITGPVDYIFSSAFRGHFNIQEVTINDPRTDSSTGYLYIGDAAFYGLFNGDASQGKITITGPIKTISSNTFGQSSWLVNNGKLYTPGGKLLYEIPAGKRYDSSLTMVEITNTGENNLEVNVKAFSNNFIYTDYAKAAASVTLKGKISKIGINVFAKLDDAKAPNGLRLRTVAIENTNLSSVASATAPSLVIQKKAFYQTMTSTLPDVHGTVTIKGPMSSIGDSAFYQPTSLMNLTINNTGSSLLTINESAFRHGFKRTAGNAGSIKITGPINYIKQYAFEFPTNVMSVDIQNTGSAAMTIANNTFAQGFRRDAAGGKISITGPVKEIGNYAFHLPTYCDNITINNTHKTSGLSIGLNAFEKAFQRAAHGTANITGNLLKIGKNAFHTPTNLMTLNIDNNVGSSTLVVDSAAFQNGFRRAEGNLGTISIQGRLSKIAYGAVGWGHNANTVTINNTGTTDLVIEKWAFPQAFRRENTAGGDITITGRLKEIGAEAFHLVANCKKVTIDNTGSGTDLVIGEKAFAGGFTKYTDAVGGILAITGKLKEIGVNAFNGCANLMDVSITHTASANPLSIGANAFNSTFLRTSTPTGKLTMNGKLASIGKSAFRYTRALKNVNITNSGTTAAVIDTMAFYAGFGCKVQSSAFETLFEDGSFTYGGPLKELGYQAFYDAYGLKTVTLNTTTEYRIMDMCFRYNRSLSELNSNNGSTKRSIPSMVRYIGTYAFQNTGFTEMTIPNLTLKPSWNPNITESNPMKQTLINQGSGDQYYPSSANAHDWYNINGNFGDYIFADCRNLQKVTINSTTTGGRAVFRNCKELTDVTLGTTVKFIEQYSFEGCTKLDHLFVPKTVSLIGTGIMYRGAPEHRITFEGTQPPHAVSNAFNGNKPNLVVPKGSVSSYLFSADNLGFQQVAGDNISCEYNLASSGWGSLGMQAHKIKEYKATVNAGRVEWLSIVDDRGTFTDVYDTRRIGVTNVDGIVTDVAPSDVVNVYTADYYYPETKKVGIDKIENFAVVPQNTSTTNRNIGYLVEGEGGTTYYLHHYTGGDMSSKIAANGETYSYGTVRDAAKSAFDSEDIPCPGAFGGSTYSRTDAPNLLIAYTGTTYTQGQNLVIDGGKYFGTEPCYYYGFAGGQFRKINGWSNFKEGNAFIAIPKRLMDESAAGKEVLSFFLMDNGDGDDWKTTGIDDLNNDGRHIEGGRDEWYTIDGIKLTERPTKKGLYIHNGRKEAIR